MYNNVKKFTPESNATELKQQYKPLCVPYATGITMWTQNWDNIVSIEPIPIG